MKNNYLTNYANDTTPYIFGNREEEMISKLKAITRRH